MPFQLQPGSTSLDLESEDSEEENDTPPKKARKTLKEDEEDAKPGSPGEENLGSPKATAHRAKANADKVLARWCAICPDKSAQGCELSCANLGGSTGSRVRLRCGMVLLLQGEVPPMTTHEAVASASAFLRQNDPVRAARALNHAAPLTVAAMVHEHIKLATQEANAERTGASPSKRAMVVDGAESDSQALTQRDRQRLALSRCSPLPVPFRVAFAPPELHELQGCDFKDGVAFAAHPRCKEHRVSAILGDCHLVSGGFMSAVQAAADNTSRAPDCIVEFDMDPFAVRFVPFPPTDETKIYSKVHAICPDGQHRAILLSLPCGCKPAAESGESGELLARSSQPPSQQLSFKCSLLRRSIERGRLFGGGRKAVEEAFTAILDSPEPFATASALRCLTLVSMEAVRLWKGRAEHVSFGSLAMLAILASSVPSWRPPLALREALLRTVAAVQAADQPESCMPWRNWRKPEIGGDDGGLEFQNDDLSQLRNALRHLTRGFLGLAAEEADMVGRYTDVMVNRGGLPLYHLPLPQPEMEETLPSDYRSAAVDCSVLPQLPLHFQAALAKPPLCESTNLKDLHLRNLRFFIEQTQFNIRQQKDIKRRGGYIEAGDMERIVNYMDEEHFAQGRDLAEARALPEDSQLRAVNSEGFTSEEECHLQSERCRSLQETLKSLQKQMLQRSLHGPPALKPRQDDSVPVEGATCIESIDPSARLDAFLSCFGGSVEVKIPGKDVGGNLRVTCARKDTPERPLLIQKAQKVSATGDRDGAFQEVLDTTLREAATKEFCKSFRKGALPRPPQGYVWNVPGPGVLRVERGDDSDQLRFFVGEVELQPFDAGPILWKCVPQPQLCIKDEDPKEHEVVQKALYLQPAQQVDLLQELQGRSQRTAGVLSWLEDARKSSIAACIWQEAYARLVLEEEHEGHPCLTLSASHPYAGTVYRMVLLLAFLYPSVLVPTRSELAFRIFRESKVQGCLHQHLKNALKTLAFNQHSSVRAGAFQGKVITPLFTYQTEAVQRLLQSRHNGAAGSLDASSLGAGKTLVAISFCMFLAAQHSGGEFLVLVPSSSLMDGWRQQIEQHTEGVRVQMQQENGVLREGVQRKSPTQTSPLRRKRPVNEAKDSEVLFIITTYSRAARHPFSCTWLLVIADECLALQNTDTLQCAASWRLVSRALYGGHFISGTMFRKHYSDLLDMLKMLRSSIPLRGEFVQAYFGAYLISYVRPQRPWSTELIPLEIPPSVQSSYSEVLDECRGRGAQNFVKVLGRMRRLLSLSLQQDARPLSEAVWRTVQELRAKGHRPLVFASTEREAEALVRHIACARRFRKNHPQHCKGCDLCRNFNKFAQPGAQNMPPIEGTESDQELLVFTVGADSAGLNLQSLGDALVLRPVQMDQLVQMMGRLDRPGQTSHKLCRAILYMKRTHEEAEVAHLQKHAAFWSLHIKPVARLIVMATDSEDVSGKYRKLLEVENKNRNATAAPENVSNNEQATHKQAEMWPHSFQFQKRSWGISEAAAASKQRKVESPTKSQVFQQIQSSTPVAINLEMPSFPELPKVMTRQSVQLGVGYLIENDDRFRHVVQLIGPPTAILELLGKGRPDPFTTLVQTVCHQQLSVKVCQGMFQRLLGLCGDRDNKILHPQRVVAQSPDKIREVAKLSFRKIQYIQKIAERFLDGTLNTEVFEEASDQELRERMTQLPGIGEWTLEMFLIFQLHRHGGIPFGDVAIQSAMKLIYNIVPPADVTAKNEVSWMPSRAQMEAFALRWGPFGSIASLYLLRVADNVNAIFLPD